MHGGRMAASTWLLLPVGGSEEEGGWLAGSMRMARGNGQHFSASSVRFLQVNFTLCLSCQYPMAAQEGPTALVCPSPMDRPKVTKEPDSPTPVDLKPQRLHQH